MSDEINPERIEILRLRTRIVALERAVLATLELALRIRPEELEAFKMLDPSTLATQFFS